MDVLPKRSPHKSSARIAETSATGGLRTLLLYGDHWPDRNSYRGADTALPVRVGSLLHAETRASSLPARTPPRRTRRSPIGRRARRVLGRARSGGSLASPCPMRLPPAAARKRTDQPAALFHVERGVVVPAGCLGSPRTQRSAKSHRSDSTRSPRTPPKHRPRSPRGQGSDACCSTWNVGGVLPSTHAPAAGRGSSAPRSGRLSPPA